MDDVSDEYERYKRTYMKLRIFTPAIVLSLSYLLFVNFCNIPQILLFCILGTVILVPMELSIILSSSKRENGVYSLKSAFVGQEKPPLWKILIIAFKGRGTKKIIERHG